MTAPTPNAELAYKVLDQIDAHPETWNQGIYIGPAECGTVACFAGWACLLSGEQPYRFGRQMTYSTAYVVGHEGEPQYVAERAEQLLSASRWIEAIDEDLFGASNTREDLGRLVAEIFGPRPESCGYTLAHPAHGWTRLANDEHPDDQLARCPGMAEERAS